MSDPIYTPPPAFVPPMPPRERRSGPGCWAWGLMSCLVLVLIAAVLIGMGLYKASKSPSGRKFFGSMGQAFGQAQELPQTTVNMKSVLAAIVRYHERNGVYPPNLAALSPDYIQSPTLLHAPLDPNPNPSHISFKYVRPAANAPQTTPVLTFTWSYTLEVGNQYETSNNKIVMALDGHASTNTTQTMSMESSPASNAGGH